MQTLFVILMVFLIITILAWLRKQKQAEVTPFTELYDDENSPPVPDKETDIVGHPKYDLGVEYRTFKVEPLEDGGPDRIELKGDGIDLVVYAGPDYMDVETSANHIYTINPTDKDECGRPIIKTDDTRIVSVKNKMRGKATTFENKTS